MNEFILVTHSTNKAREIERLLGRPVPCSSIELDEIQAVEVEDVVTHKARLAYSQVRAPVMVEDTGLHIDCWGGLPGALVKWFIERAGPLNICRMVDPFEDRSARAVTVVATCDGSGAPLVFKGEVRGRIPTAPTGDSGFGWDSIFVPDGSNRTFAEMNGDEKDWYSMRRLAFGAMRTHYDGRSTGPA